MTPHGALVELLARVGAADGSAVFFSVNELDRWPTVAVARLKKHKVLREARPAKSVVCPGCERECAMPVHVVPATDSEAQAFVVCDKRSDINRVAIAVSHLEQFVASGKSVADLLACLLGLHRPDGESPSPSRWEIGMLKGRKHASYLVLLGGGELTLSLAGHSVALANVLQIAGNRLVIDKEHLIRLIDSPVAGAGDVESAAQRRVRLKAEIRAEKLKGTRAFLQAVAEREGISKSRLKQLVYEARALAGTGARAAGQPNKAIPSTRKLQR